MIPTLKDYDLIILNSSGGKDSLAAKYEVARIAKDQGYPLEKIIVSHQCLGESEWKGTKELAKKQADLFGFGFIVSKRRDKDGKEETLLEYAERRGKFPSSKQRWCTSDFKRAPGGRVVTKLTKEMTGHIHILYVFGFRASESPARSKKEVFSLNTNLSITKRRLPKAGHKPRKLKKERYVWDWLPIHAWDDQKVWDTIHNNNLPYHKAYDLGMPRLSCVFCIFAPKNALLLAAIHNPELYEKYVAVEKKIKHKFKPDLSLESLKDDIKSGCTPNSISSWKM